MCGPVVLTHQDSGEGTLTGDEEGACVLWSPPRTTLSRRGHPVCSEAEQSRKALIWAGGAGEEGRGRVGVQRREKGECLENERPFGESCVCARTGSVSPTQAGVAGQTRDRCSWLGDSLFTPEQQRLPHE